MLQTVVSLISDARLIIYDCDMFIIQVTGDTSPGDTRFGRWVQCRGAKKI
jgi:hypothetical protein